MTKNLAILITALFMFLSYEMAYAERPIKHPPAETIVLKLPSQEYANWKESYRLVNENEGVVDHIPQSQTVQELYDLIRISFHHRATLNCQEISSLEELVEKLQDTTQKDPKGRKIIYKIIEKNPNDIIYECIHEPLQRLPPNMALSPCQVIARVFETDNGLHCVEVNRFNGRMSTNQREKWIKTLKESASVVSYEEAFKALEGLSLADRIKDSLDLGEFHNWKTLRTCLTDTGQTRICYILPSASENYPMEILEVITQPNLRGASVEDVFEVEKLLVEQQLGKKTEFHFLKKFPTDIIYRYSRQEDLLQVTTVIRTFISGQGIYSICYIKRQVKELTKEEIARVQGQLEKIKVRKDSN